MTTLFDTRSALSRRTVLIGCAIGGAALASGASAAMRESPVKVSQDSVRYQTTALAGRTCGECKLFLAPSSCVAVAGPITSTCGCRIWLPKVG